MNLDLEGYLRSDVYSTLANKICQVLVPLLRPRYTARLEIYLVEDNAPEAEVGILYPDVEVLQVRDALVAALQLTQPGTLATTAAQLTLPVLQPVEVRVPTVEIRDTALNILVTCIEILSPVNQRELRLTGHRQQHQRLDRAGVSSIEIDLLRRGSRPFNHPRLPGVPYLINLTRASSGVVDVWTLELQDRLPVIPVPLRQPDPDVPLDLAAVLSAIYDEAAYDLSIDYRATSPPPLLSESDRLWLENLLAPMRRQ